MKRFETWVQDIVDGQVFFLSMEEPSQSVFLDKVSENGLRLLTDVQECAA